MASTYQHLVEPEVLAFGKAYGTGFGFTMEELTIFYLYSEKLLTPNQIAEILGEHRENIRKKLVSVLRTLRKYKMQFDE